MLTPIPLRYLLAPRPVDDSASKKADDKQQWCPQVILGSIPACMPLHLALNDLEARGASVDLITYDSEILSNILI